ncbi:MAG: phosphoribosyl-ATP diphosphatase [Gammaproteobacteria bacterium]|jgi:phosphoribosyl-ATP pyrophosphohydrolase|nr:phosphoribosyl-ATP diphosphatase [Gammaproteobacteria bacterium]
MSRVLFELAEVLEKRKSANGDASYVASLHEKGLNKILEKVIEEATETILAAKECNANSIESKAAVISETADLWFHTMVMLSHLNMGPDQVLVELEKRFDISGLDEKASRKIETSN